MMERPISDGGTVLAALVTLTIDPDQAPAAASALVNDILPTVRSLPGFVAGYWLERADGKGLLDREIRKPPGAPRRMEGGDGCGVFGGPGVKEVARSSPPRLARPPATPSCVRPAFGDGLLEGFGGVVAQPSVVPPLTAHRAGNVVK
jgi:hypothetical protein